MLPEHFSVGPLPNRTCDFHRIRLSSVLCFAVKYMVSVGFPCTSVANDSQYGCGIAHLAHLPF